LKIRVKLPDVDETIGFMPAVPNGPTALVITVPEAEIAVGRWRNILDRSAGQGMPAHVTILYPFLTQTQVTDDVWMDLTKIVLSQQVFELELTSCARFPAGTLYLQPRQAGPIVLLTEKIAARWPECPPYGGMFSEVIPHLTVAESPTDVQVADICASICPYLPIRCTVSNATLFAPEGQTWRPWRKLHFAAAQ
jgi:2'-5' RNA ligase